MDFFSLSGEATSGGKIHMSLKRDMRKNCELELFQTLKYIDLDYLLTNTKIVQQIAQTSVAPPFSLI